jgi:hypothetical protein
MFGGMFAMFCILEFIPGIGWLSPLEFGPDKTPGLCRLIDDIEEVDRVCPWDIEGLVFGMAGLGCPCQPWLGLPDMELLLAPTMLGCPPMAEPPIMFILPMPCFMAGFMPPIIIMLGFMFMLFPIWFGSLILSPSGFWCLIIGPEGGICCMPGFLTGGPGILMFGPPGPIPIWDIM